VTTLHIFRSRPRRHVRELIRVITPGRFRPVALYREVVDYDRLIDAVFAHDRVICWW